jgi:hypothetical protein
LEDLGVITLPAEPETAVLAQIRASAEASQASRRRTTHAGATPGLRLKSSPPPSHRLRPRRANPPAAGQREGSSRGYWLDSQRFSDGRLEFADAILELNDMLGRSRRGRDGWREKCEDAKHRHQKLQKLDGDWLAWRAGRILAQIGPCWQGRRKGDSRSRRHRKAGLRFGGRVPAEVINEGRRD